VTEKVDVFSAGVVVGTTLELPKQDAHFLAHKDFCLERKSCATCFGNFHAGKNVLLSTLYLFYAKN